MLKRVAIIYGWIVILGMSSTVWALTGMDVFNQYQKQEKHLENMSKTMILQQTMTGQGMQASITMYKKGQKSRVETIIQKSSNPMLGKTGMKNIIIDDGVSTWLFNPMTGKIKEPNDPDEDKEQVPQKVDYLTKETISGIKCHKIKVFYQSASEILWINISNHVLVQQVSIDGGSKETTTNSNFKTVKGVVFPWKITIKSDGSTQQMDVKSLKINTKIADDLFDPHQVKGYDKAAPGYQKATQQSNKMMEMMKMGMEIQRLYQKGETEKAQALEKKMQQMQSY